VDEGPRVRAGCRTCHGPRRSCAADPGL
jgi:hypothetical protein